MGWSGSRKFLWAIVALGVAAASIAHGATVKGRVNITAPNGEVRAGRDTAVVVWLTPLSNGRVSLRAADTARPRIVQKNKRFETRVLVAQVGAVVDFPNLDPFFHNVFSLFDGKRFDLGLYEAGSTRSVRFDRPGVCYIFCNIHSQMSTAVVVVDTPYFVVLNTPGEFEIPGVPSGLYQLNVWAERCSPKTLKDFSRQVTITENSGFIGTIQMPECRESVHSNKYGKDYDPQVFSNPTYARP